MKYVVLKVKVGSTEREMPFIFPNLMVHQNVAAYMVGLLHTAHGWDDCEIVAAGEVSLFGGVSCSGGSESLGVKSRGKQDEELFQMYDYLHGVIL